MENQTERIWKMELNVSWVHLGVYRGHVNYFQDVEGLGWCSDSDMTDFGEYISATV